MPDAAVPRHATNLFQMQVLRHSVEESQFAFEARFWGRAEHFTSGSRKTLESEQTAKVK
jgi:hypothetical protein